MQNIIATGRLLFTNGVELQSLSDISIPSYVSVLRIFYIPLYFTFRLAFKNSDLSIPKLGLISLRIFHIPKRVTEFSILVYALNCLFTNNSF